MNDNQKLKEMKQNDANEAQKTTKNTRSEMKAEGKMENQTVCLSAINHPQPNETHRCNINITNSSGCVCVCEP